MIAKQDCTFGRAAVVALGGGGARGISHFGALEAVFDSSVEVERIVGVSIGGLAGALCAIDPNIRKTQAHVIDYLTSDAFETKQESLFGTHPKAEPVETSGMLAWYDRIKQYLWARQLLNRIVRKQSLLSCAFLEEVIEELVPDIGIEDTTVPLSIVAVDLKTGHPVVLERGSLRRAVFASAAIPGIFPPVEWDNLLLSDIGVVDSLPARIARSYASDLVIGVDVGPTLESTEYCETALHVLLRIDEIAERLYRRYSLQDVDILIRPDVGHFQWFDFSRPQDFISAGFESGRHSLSQWCQQSDNLSNPGPSLPYSLVPPSRL